MVADFEYFCSTANLREAGLLDEVLARMEQTRLKNPEILLPADEIAKLMDTGGRILSVVREDGVVVGFVLYCQFTDALTQRNVLCVELAHLDNRPGLFEAVEVETTRLAAFDDSSIRVTIFRRGWQKRMKMAQQTGYKVTGISLEKSHGFRR